MTALLRIGSRVSPLAMTQTKQVRSMVAAVQGLADDDLAISGITTTGDAIQDRRLREAGGKGLFTKELDEALLDRRIDVAVHSMKDLPTKLPPGLALICVPAREDPRDALICATASDIADLPAGALVGTASLRRQAQTLHRRPDLKVETLRGSVETRLKRVAEGSVAATFLALAGLKRLGLAQHARRIFQTSEMLPAVGQGALAIVAREDDAKARALFAPIAEEEDWVAVTAERAFLDALDGSCRTPIAAFARVEGSALHFSGEVLSADGRLRWAETATLALSAAPRDEAAALGRRLGEAIRCAAGDAFPIDPDP
ncbi:MAG: hydroxymethylbilane synthase [Alphaproteobacteria bacterium]|nr:hydroxymethylbilane synthase [Alphaproteobacteria bacterium]